MGAKGQDVNVDTGQKEQMTKKELVKLTKNVRRTWAVGATQGGWGKLQSL